MFAFYRMRVLMAASLSTLLSAIIPIAIILPIFIIRIKRMSKGTRVSTRKAVLFSVGLAVISTVLVASSFSMGISLYFIPVYAIISGVAGYLAYLYSDKSLHFWKTADGSIYVKGGTSIFLLYMISVVARIAISSAFGGTQGFFGNSQGISETALTTAMIFDGLLVTGAALLIGRNVRIISKDKRITEGKEGVEYEA